MGARDEHTLKAFIEAESYPGVSLIIAYSHCIAHGIDLDRGLGARQQKLAVDSGEWLLYRYDPRRVEHGDNPLQLDSPPPKIKLEDYLMTEIRFKMLTKTNPKRQNVCSIMLKRCGSQVQVLQYLAQRDFKRVKSWSKMP
jgi:pyruvate-ferredoxin/flavodoxin oxidoreductase